MQGESSAADSQQFLAWAFSDQKSDGEEEVLEDAKTRKRRLNVELAKALAVLNIKPSTFHSFHYGGKKEKVKKLLEQALIARTKDTNERTVEEMDAEFNINFEVADLATIHESYQFLYKKYVAEGDKVVNENFITAEELKKKHEKRKKKQKEKKDKEKNNKGMDVDMITDMKLKGRKARRSSFVQMTGLDVDAEKDQESLAASAVASEMLDAPTPSLKRRGSTKRRKSVLLGLDMDDGSSSGDESFRGPSPSTSRRGSLRPTEDAKRGTSGSRKKSPAPSSRRGSLRRPSLFDEGGDEPTGISLLNRRDPSPRAPSPSMKLRRGRPSLGGRTLTTVSWSTRRESLFDTGDPITDQSMMGPLTNHIYGEPEKTYPAGVLPDPSPALKRRGSAYRSKKKTKDNSKPYPKRKGSFRRFAGGEDDD